MKKKQIEEIITKTAGAEVESLMPIEGGLSDADKFKVQLNGQDWMVKVVSGNATRDLWYQELAARSDERMACPKMHRLFEDGTLCLISPWIEGESLEERLHRGNKDDLQCFGEQAADILLKLHQIPFYYPAYTDTFKKRVNMVCDQVEELRLTFPMHGECCDYLRHSVEKYSADYICFVHRDIRPENFIVNNERLYLIDFDNGSLGERATDFSYITTMGGEQFYPFSKEVLKKYLAEADDGTFWSKNLLYSTLQVAEYAIWKYQTKGKQVRLQAENLYLQYDHFKQIIPIWWKNSV